MLDKPALNAPTSLPANAAEEPLPRTLF